jgi:hypothetical protein
VGLPWSEVVGIIRRQRPVQPVLPHERLEQVPDAVSVLSPRPLIRSPDIDSFSFPQWAACSCPFTFPEHPHRSLRLAVGAGQRDWSSLHGVVTLTAVVRRPDRREGDHERSGVDDL